MNKKFLSFALGAVALVGVGAFSIMTSGCNKDTESAAEKVYPNTEYITRYMEARDTIDVKPLAPGYAAYFDFSDGVNMAYNDPTSKENLHNIVNAVTTPETEFYSLGSLELKPMTGDSEQIFQDIMNPKNYAQQAAPIRKALQQIIDQNKPALLVTDYEEYDGGKIFKGAYAKQYFIEWLKRGYDITFYIVDYKEKGKDKKLFYTVFDGKDGKLMKKIEAGLNGKPVNYRTFTMGNNNYKIITDYPSAAKGGNYHNEKGEDDVTTVCENPDEDCHYVKMDEYCSEFYPLEESFQRINRMAALKLRGTNRDYPPTVFRYFAQNLFISTDDLPYKDVKLDINTYSVQDDYEAFHNHLTAIKATPTNSNDDPYYEPDGKLKPEFEYNPMPFNEIKDLFVFVNEPTKIIKGYEENGGKSHPGYREVGFTFSEDFNTENKTPVTLNGLTKSYPSDDLIRVDIVISDVNYLKDTELDDLFKWGNYDNLSESIRLALHEVSPKGKVLYTYYISPFGTSDTHKDEYDKDFLQNLYPDLDKLYDYYAQSEEDSED
ncbi:MAG: hypothetical protein HDS88_01405 [Bacteroidales bacterium]|nr:hypothetical protein [Bacteroidales bacterium]